MIIANHTPNYSARSRSENGDTCSSTLGARFVPLAELFTAQRTAQGGERNRKEGEISNPKD